MNVPKAAIGNDSFLFVQFDTKTINDNIKMTFDIIIQFNGIIVCQAGTLIPPATIGIDQHTVTLNSFYIIGNNIEENCES